MQKEILKNFFDELQPYLREFIEQNPEFIISRKIGEDPDEPPHVTVSFYTRDDGVKPSMLHTCVRALTTDGEVAVRDYQIQKQISRDNEQKAADFIGAHSGNLKVNRVIRDRAAYIYEAEFVFYIDGAVPSFVQS